MDDVVQGRGQSLGDGEVVSAGEVDELGGGDAPGAALGGAVRVEAEMAEGRDMLAQMAARTRVHIRKSQRRLQNLKNVNQAQEEYVKEKFGMDIEDFRGQSQS